MLSPEPMNTRPSTIDADDLTGPPDCKLQSNDNLSGSEPEATPVRAGLPRNMGQFAVGCARPSEAWAAAEATRIVATVARNKLDGCENFMRNPSQFRSGS